MIDTHAHLDGIDNLEAALRKARKAGVEQIIAVGMDLASNEKTLELSRRFPGIIYPAIGYHPWSITPEGIESNLAYIEHHLAACIALGEVGLDYQTKIKKRLQQEVFIRLLRMAAHRDMPVIVHARYSHLRAYHLVRDAGIEKAVFHWYSGPLEVLHQIIADGYLVSATPALSYSPPHQAAIGAAPLEQILLETDAPEKYQERVSEPADLVITAKELSRIKGLNLQEAINITTANARRFFGL